MPSAKGKFVLWATAAFAVLNVVLGWIVRSLALVGGGACALCYVFLRMLRWSQRTGNAPGATPAPLPAARPKPAAVRFPARPDDACTLVRQMLAQGRYALLLRPQIAGGLDERLFGEALEALQAAMALVPDGEVVLGGIDDALEDGKLEAEEIAAHRGRVVAVERFFLDRYAVTNREFFEFVAAGGYEQAALWDEAVLPAVLDFVDRTGQPGPRFWRQGCYAAGKEDHPVTGVSWYEAAAYAQWAGKRLPTDAEWVKAACWPVQVSAATRMQRKYPWGETMDRRRANLWGSGPGDTVPVTSCADGVSVGGIHQLIGNVWEWTASTFRAADLAHGPVVLDAPMKSIRGGAFDTYFDNQATCQFQSGEGLLSRKHNIGFRCGVGVCDLMLLKHGPQAAADAGAGPEDEARQPEDTPAEEVTV